MALPAPFLFFCLIAVAEAPIASDVPTFPPEALEFFERSVRPVLAENCYGCHGPSKQENGLRLDGRAGLLTGGISGPAAVDGDPAQSLLLQVVKYDGPIKMPPTGKLPDSSIEALNAWVAMSMPWPPDETSSTNDSLTEKIAKARREHWAFQPVRKPEPPAVVDPAVQSPIDRFVLRKLENAGLARNPPADKRTLIRRATFGLIGLPPTPEDVAAFEADSSPEAFAKVVDRLLESPRYGERWARHWLDVARYADTKGYVFEEERDYGFAYTYRDYVIDAFNRDLGYDQFIREQLAADQMDLGEEKRPLAAMGFLTLGRRFINNIHDITDDRIDVVTRGMLGLTVTCARCHEHKYDPIGMEDYYSLYGVFRSSREPDELPLIENPDAGDPAYQEYQAALSDAEKALEDLMFEVHAELLAHARDRAADYLLAAHDSRDMTEDAPFRTLARDRELRWQVLEQWRSYMKELESRSEAFSIYGPWLAFSAIADGQFADKAPAIARSAAERQLNGSVNAAIAKQFEGDPPISLSEVAERYRKAFAAADKAWTDLLAAQSQAVATGASVTPPAVLSDPALEAVRLELYGPDRPANVPRSNVEGFSDVPTRNRIRQKRNAVARVASTHPARPDRAMSLIDSDKPFEPHVFLRGNPERKGPAVKRRFLAVLSEGAPAPFTRGSGRLELADAIASADNPLTTRVLVNRVWMYHFGEPLVSTPSDFGLRSTLPTQLELLDFLAAEFMEDDWSIKSLHRQIMLSDTYQQSSESKLAGATIDPENRLLWRQNRQRLDFEAMRDALIAASGRLEIESAGGPSVDITNEPYPLRRTVYGFIERQNLPGIFRTFDFAGPDTHSPRRYTTTVPQQALFMLNSPFVVQQARALAGRPEVETAKTDEEKVTKLHDIVYQRSPVSFDMDQAISFLRERSIVEPAPVAAARAWDYGYGTFDPVAGSVKSFSMLPHFTGKAYQGGPELPNADLGWVMVNMTGGHPGGDSDHAAIRRWTAPIAGTFDIRGTLRHGEEHGDGVRGVIVHNECAPLWSGTVHHGEAATDVAGVCVQGGDRIDFVVFCGETEAFDSFDWSPSIKPCVGDTSDREWQAEADFAGPLPDPPTPLTPLEQYAQVLLLTNEFLFID